MRSLWQISEVKSRPDITSPNAHPVQFHRVAVEQEMESAQKLRCTSLEVDNMAKAPVCCGRETDEHKPVVTPECCWTHSGGYKEKEALCRVQDIRRTSSGHTPECPCDIRI